ncbi:MAG: hypothetical protein FJ118_12575 [Deltaproteobacteria bacterium]|nr:hypothetical protein [Deltaproteobacteria bacterium]
MKGIDETLRGLQTLADATGSCLVGLETRHKKDAEMIAAIRALIEKIKELVEDMLKTDPS